MTDNDIIKALECCINGKCNGCPLYAMNCSPKVAMAFSADLINRQKAEIERLEKVSHDWENCFHRMDSLYHIKCMELKVATAEAIKGFKASLWAKLCKRDTPPFVFNFINATEEEMVGERE